jgi:transcriptional regulator with XRE-family HTH domain
MNVKQILKNIKERLGVSSYELAKLTGISAQVLSHWERNDAKTVKLELLAKLRKGAKMDWKQLGKMIDEEFEG